jgi:hypothetical protein
VGLSPYGRRRRHPRPQRDAPDAVVPPITIVGSDA